MRFMVNLCVVGAENDKTPDEAFLGFEKLIGDFL